MDAASALPFLGPWDGPVTIAGSTGMIRIGVRPEVGESPEDGLGLSATFDFDPGGGWGLPIPEVDVVDGELQLRDSATAIDLRLKDGSLVGEIRTAYFGDAPLELRRGHPASLPYLTARATPTALQLAAPEDLSDGWAVTTAADAGLDETKLQSVITSIIEGRQPYVDDVLITVEGKLAVEEYFFGRGPEHTHCVQSATKSITSLVFGTLVDRGEVKDLDDPAWKYLPGRAGRRWVDEQYDVSLHEVLSMTVGLDWNEVVPIDDPRNDAARMNEADDWVGYVLDKPLRKQRDPKVFEYQSGTTLLLGELIRAITGQTVDDLARERLFAPLQIGEHAWAKHADGTVHTGGGLWIRPRDFAKLGQLVLDEGRWAGEQVLSEDWVRLSTSEQSNGQGTGYGYHWFRPPLPGANGSLEVVCAMGFGGQILMVLRDFGAVVVTNAHDWASSGGFPLLHLQHLIPALPDRKSAPPNGR